jgi:hypothetical protein
MPVTTPPKPVSLKQFRAARYNAPGTPILTTAAELLRQFRTAVYFPVRFPKGTVGLVLRGLPKGNFVGFEMCMSDPDVECWYDERAQHCLCNVRSGPGIPGTGIVPIRACTFDRTSLRCLGTCRGPRVCRLVYTLTGHTEAVAAARAVLGAAPTLSASLKYATTNWVAQLHLNLGCACRPSS